MAGTKRGPRRIQMVNRTHWSTADLRAFVRRAAAEVLEPGTKPFIHCTVSYNRAGTETYVTGRAYLHGTHMRLMVPRNMVDRIDLAHVAAHEVGHLRGVDHAAMRGSARWRRVGRWREIYAWGETLPLRKMEPRQRQTGIELVTRRAAQVDAGIARWEAKAKRAANALRKLRARKRYYQRRAAAHGKGQ